MNPLPNERRIYVRDYNNGKRTWIAIGTIDKFGKVELDVKLSQFFRTGPIYRGPNKK